jgi:Spy/CpxP family protein refolding chaperone
LQEHDRYHHHGGVTRLIAMSLDTLEPDDTKKAELLKIQNDLKAELAPARDADKELLLTIATGVASGNLDTLKVDAGVEKVAAASQAAQQASLATLNKLHAVLSPEERQALADKVQAHWEVWRDVNGEQQQPGRLTILAERLSLTPEQLTKITAALRTAMATPPAAFDTKPGEAHIQAFCAAFPAETFDAKTLAANANGHMSGQGARRMALFYKTITPLLTPEQRAKLADHLREHANHSSASA